MTENRDQSELDIALDQRALRDDRDRDVGIVHDRIHAHAIENVDEDVGVEEQSQSGHSSRSAR